MDFDFDKLRETMRARIKDVAHISEGRKRFSSFVDFVATDERGERLPSWYYVNLFSTCIQYAHKNKLHFAHATPPGLGKSTLARLYVLYCIGHNNHLRTVVISGDEQAARDSVSLCRSILLTDSYRLIFPWALPDYELSMIGNIKNPEDRRSTRGWRGRCRRAHCT